MLAAMACGASTSGGGSGKGVGGSETTSPASGSFGSFGPPGSGACVPQAPGAFYNAICVCEDLTEAGTLTTHAPAQGQASVGVNGRSAAGTGASIEGSFTAYDGLDVGGLLSVRDDVVSTQTVDGAGVFDIGKDLSVGGPFTFAGALSVDGTLRLAQPSTVFVPVHVSQTGPYTAPSSPPCGCDAASLLPIAQAVAQAAIQNDNAAHGLATDGASLVGAGSLTLTTGSYYFEDVTRIGLGEIDIQGNVSVYLDGPSVTVGVGQFSIAPGSSLDLYVSGVLATAGAVALGDPSHPEAFRLFVGGAGSMIATAGAQAWSGLVYAPQADVAFGGVTEVHGSIFAKTLTWGGALDVTYSGGALTSGSTCPTPPAPGANN
jgi:hypothetical protein